MAEKTSTCDHYIGRETFQVYLHLAQALCVVDGRDCLNQHLPQHWIGRTIAEDRSLLRWPPKSPDLMPYDVLPPVTQDLPELRDETSSPPPQKSIVSCCSEYGLKWIIGLTPVLFQRADTYSELRRYAKKDLYNFYFQL